MANIKEQIISWFNGPQDYDQGIKLLQQVSKKNKVLGKLIKRGESRGSMEKIRWELNKVARFKRIPGPRSLVKKEAPKVPKAPKRPKAPKKEKVDEKGLRFNLIGEKSIDSYPPEVNRLVKEYSSQYMLRGKKHAAIKKLPEDNSKETIAARVELIEAIKKISDRLEILNNAFQAYEKEGISFDPDVLWPKPTITEGTTGNKGPGQDPAGVNIDDLKNQKKNIQASITKDRNLLAFGAKTKPKDGKENPMPEGPKRTKLEKRIAKKEKDIVALAQHIAELG